MTTPATPALPNPQPGNQPATAPGSWSQAANDSSAMAGAASSPNAPPTQPAAPGNANATPVTAPPPTAQPVRPRGLRGFVDRMLDSMAGTDTSRIRREPDGTLYIQHETPTRGQQWLRIASDAFRGAAAGMAAGKGAGNQGKAALAGFESEEQVQGQRKADYQNQLVAVANSQMLKHTLAAQAFQMTRLGVEAAQQDIEFSQKRADWLKTNGGTPIGHVTDLAGLAKLMRETPGFHADQVQHDLMVPVQQYDADGKANGFEIYRMPQGYGEEVTPPGTEFHVFNPATGKLEVQKTTEWMPKSKLNSAEMAAGTAMQEYNLKQADIEQKKAQAGQETAAAGEQAATARTKPSEAAKNYAEAELDRAKAEQARAGMMLPDGTPNPAFDLMAQQIIEGNILPKDLKRQAKGMGLDPNQLMLRAFELAKANGQELSVPILEQMDKFAASPKTQAALDGIDRVIGAPGVSGYMEQMLAIARQASLVAGPGAGAGNTLQLGVRRFLGDAAAKNLETSIAETRRSIAGLIGNPLLGGSETDKRLEQAEEMLGKSPTLENLESATNILKTALQSQRQSIVGNNIYLTKRYGAAYKQTPTAAGTVQMRAPDGSVSAVPAAQVDYYKSKGATVVQ